MRSRTSETTLPRVIEVRVSGDRLNRARMRLSTSEAEFASRMIRSTVVRARSRLGGSVVSQRWHAWEFATIAANGWFTSCAIDAESSARLAAWLARASFSDA